MKFFAFIILVISARCYSQNKATTLLGSKGEHYALYNKCKTAVMFCELTQQGYTSCGSVKNCYGLYVLPGDTFYINIEDKNQGEVISADMSFDGYFPSISSFTFEPVDNNCMATQALQIAIPLTAIAGSSFQIVAQNTDYVNSALTPGTPPPFPIYVGGQQAPYTFALSDFTTCPVVEEVSVREIPLQELKLMIYPNPTSGEVYLQNFNSKQTSYVVELYDVLGNKIFTRQHMVTEKLTLPQVANGIYFFRVLADSNMAASQRLIIER